MAVGVSVGEERRHSHGGFGDRSGQIEDHDAFALFLLERTPTERGPVEQRAAPTLRAKAATKDHILHFIIRLLPFTAIGTLGATCSYQPSCYLVHRPQNIGYQ